MALLNSLSLALIMSSQRFYGGVITLCLLLSCRASLASVAEPPVVAPTPVTSGPPPASSGGYLYPVNPAIPNQTDLPTPAAMALPVNGPSLPGDSSTTRKFYTLTASLREVYDDNVGTSNINKVSSLETVFSPSVLVDFPTPEGDFSASYTLDLTYYNNLNNNNNSNSGNGGIANIGYKPQSIQYDQQVIAQYTHAFSERFNLNLGEQFRYYYEPSMYEDIGTAYNNGQYVANVINGTFSAQWTPLFGTTTTYSNIITRYDNSVVGAEQNNIENTGSQNFSFSVLPKFSVSVGGIADNITYDAADRGYTTYTGYVGAQWQALPSLSITGRGGLSYYETTGTGAQSSTSPYAAMSINWSLGARSSLSFDYAHEITPSYQIGSNGQVSDRISANFQYNITTFLSSHLQTSLTNSNITNQLSSTSTLNGYTQLQYFLDTGLTYHYNSYLNFESGISLSGVSSNSSIYNYSRDEIYLGVRGTY